MGCEIVSEFPTSKQATLLYFVKSVMQSRIPTSLYFGITLEQVSKCLGNDLTAEVESAPGNFTGFPTNQVLPELPVTRPTVQWKPKVYGVRGADGTSQERSPR